MRASRLLQILLLLQNRGRMTAGRLAEALEVAPRTIHRDVDAMTEAGLPIIVHRGHGGGIELGFNYRTRLTGLAADEAEAIGILLSSPAPLLDAIGLGAARARGAAKLIESFPDKVRAHAQAAVERFHLSPPAPPDDSRVAALALAIRESRVVRARARSSAPLVLHPVRLTFGADGWAVTCGRSGRTLPLAEIGDLNISALTFSPKAEVYLERTTETQA